ncbi:MAG TPA: M56 family metallopeptidase, partial [Lacipirellulaceae bacterium]|nr:M56 family metallopeptidase [Lacipirellulaceae bacterium]
MNIYSLANVSDLWFLAGWTMVHFLWLGTIVAAAAIVARTLLRHAPPIVRYTVALGCLLTLAALPIAAAAWLTKYPPPLKGGAGGGITPAIAQSTMVTLPTPVVPALQNQVIELHVADSVSAPASAGDVVAASALHATQPAAPDSAGGSLTPLAPSNVDTSKLAVENPRQSRGLYSVKQPSAFADLYLRIEAYVAYLPWLWLVGSPLTFALLVSGLVGTRRLGRASQPIEAADPIADLLAHLATSLRISRRVTVAVCERVAAPVLIGIVRPMILLPPAAITGWSPDEIEMVLLHELAHVRRWDNLVNLLQRCIESLLFFHPAVWFISSWVRHEREACCDALVVDRTNRPHAYAELIVALAAQLPRSVLFHPAASSAMAAGPLRSRIRRILKLEDDPMLISGKSLAMLITSAVAATALAFYLPTTGHADQPNAEAKADSVGLRESFNAPDNSDQNAAKLLGKFGIDPTKELGSSDASNMGELFTLIPTVNSIASRSYPISPQQYKPLEAAFNAIKHGPLNKHISFKTAWNGDHSIVAIEAPKLALDGFFDP